MSSISASTGHHRHPTSNWENIDVLEARARDQRDALDLLRQDEDFANQTLVLCELGKTEFKLGIHNSALGQDKAARNHLDAARACFRNAEQIDVEKLRLLQTDSVFPRSCVEVIEKAIKILDEHGAAASRPVGTWMTEFQSSALNYLRSHADQRVIEICIRRVGGKNRLRPIQALKAFFG